MVSFSFQTGALLVLSLITGIQSRSIGSRNLAARGSQPYPFWIQVNGLWLTESGQLSPSQQDAAICQVDATTGMSCGDYNSHISVPQSALATTVTTNGKSAGGITAGWLVSNPAINTFTLSWTTDKGSASFQVDKGNMLWAVFDGATVAGGQPVDLVLVM